MSRSACFYVGPYAMWVDASPPDDAVGDLWGSWGSDDLGMIEPGQRPVRVVFYAPSPDSSRAGAPAGVQDTRRSRLRRVGLPRCRSGGGSRGFPYGLQVGAG